MASSHNYNSPVLLGFVDCEIFGKDSIGVDFKVSKIGGTPDWPIPSCNTPVCKGCSNVQVLIVQMYAPVVESSDHRTLYFFACLTPTCMGLPHSWTCIRVQCPATPEPQRSNDVKASSSKKSDCNLFEIPDVWATDSDEESENDDNANLNVEEEICDNANLNSLQMEATVPTTSTSNYRQSTTCMSDNNINLNNRNANMCTVEIDSESTTVNMSKLNLNQGNGNGAVGGLPAAERMEDEETPSAFIEESEDDMVTVESPDKPAEDLSKWFKTPTDLSPTWSAPDSLCSFYIRVSEEPAKLKNKSSHNAELLQKYAAQKHNLDDSQKGDSGSDGLYMKGIPKHGDVYIHKFKKRVADAPDQILRYCKDSGTGPLLLQKLCRDPATRCSLCGSSLSFEVQIMPQLIPSLIARNLNKAKLLSSTNDIKKDVPSSEPLKKGKNNLNSPSHFDVSNSASDVKNKVKKNRDVNNPLQEMNNEQPSTQYNKKISKSIPLSGTVEFGTILVYTCTSSCWNGKPVQETLIVQAQI